MNALTGDFILPSYMIGFILGTLLVACINYFPKRNFAKIIFNIWPFPMLGLAILNVRDFFQFYTFIDLGSELLTGITRISFGLLSITILPAIILYVHMFWISFYYGSKSTHAEKYSTFFKNKKDINNH